MQCSKLRRKYKNDGLSWSCREENGVLGRIQNDDAVGSVPRSSNLDGSILVWALHNISVTCDK